MLEKKKRGFIAFHATNPRFFFCICSLFVGDSSQYEVAAQPLEQHARYSDAEILRCEVKITA